MVTGPVRCVAVTLAKLFLLARYCLPVLRLPRRPQGLRPAPRELRSRFELRRDLSWGGTHTASCDFREQYLIDASGTDLTGLSANTDIMEASGPDLTGLSISDALSDACVSSKAVSELLYLPPGRGRLGPTRFHLTILTRFCRLSVSFSELLYSDNFHYLRGSFRIFLNYLIRYTSRCSKGHWCSVPLPFPSYLC